ncbi:MAG: glycosyltransferase [Lacipirellulaceae bacterium]
MHFVLTALGSYGDVHPMVGLGRGLAARGHEVDVVTNPFFASMVSEAGLRFVGVSTADTYDRMTRDPGLWKPREGLDLVLREGAIAILDELYEVVTRLNRPGETVIGAHGLDLASRVAVEAIGARVVSVVYAPMAMWSSASPPRMPFGINSPRWLARAQFRFGEWAMTQRLVGKPINALRRRVGLGPLRQRYFDWYYGVAPPVCLFPDWFAPDPGDWPAGTVTTGFPLWDGGDERPLSDDLLRFLDAGDAPIAFTPGSAHRHARAFFSAAADACRLLGKRGVLLSKYDEHLPRSLAPQLIAPGFVPLSRLLPRCAAIVHHGGIGTSAQGLLAGVPQLVQPMGFDQHDNAQRLVRLGVAEELAPKRFTAERVAAALGRLLASESVKRSAQALALRCDPIAWRAEACNAIERRFTLPA